MHTVTKVLVVFAAVLCVLLAALTMAYSVNVDRVMSDYQKQVELRNTADQQKNAQGIQFAEQQASLQRDIDKKNNELTQRGTEIAQLQSERGQLIKDKSDAVAAREEIVHKIDDLTASNKTMALLIESYRGEVTKLREAELVYRKHEIELADRINDLESQRDVNDQSIRALQEQLVEARRALDAAGSAVSLGDTKATGPIKPSFPISAKVIDTGTDKATGAPMATINVGTNNQVRENMQLVILRDGAYLADFIVTQADLQWCRGRIDAHGQKVDVRAGDKISSLVNR